ncbi:hypothetical protein BHM03_00015863, partial [Ensete ventricosum]
GLAMANEIVPAEGPSDPPSRTSSMPSVRPPRVPQYSPSPFDSEKVPPTLVADVRRFLRVANQIESESPRVAYHCKKKPSFPPGSSWTIYISRLTRFLDRHGKKKAELRDYSLLLLLTLKEVSVHMIDIIFFRLTLEVASMQLCFFQRFK